MVAITIASLHTEQFLGLIDRQHEGRRRAVRRIEYLVVGHPLRLGEPGPHPPDVAHTPLDVAKAGLRQSQPGSQLVDRLRKTAVTGERVALRPNNAHRKEVTIVTAQPRQQARAQER
jgi:hypothetical protein